MRSETKEKGKVEVHEGRQKSEEILFRVMRLDGREGRERRESGTRKLE